MPLLVENTLLGNTRHIIVSFFFSSVFIDGTSQKYFARFRQKIGSPEPNLFPAGPRDILRRLWHPPRIYAYGYKLIQIIIKASRVEIPPLRGPCFYAPRERNTILLRKHNINTGGKEIINLKNSDDYDRVVVGGLLLSSTTKRPEPAGPFVTLVRSVKGRQGSTESTSPSAGNSYLISGRGRVIVRIIIGQNVRNPENQSPESSFFFSQNHINITFVAIPRMK